MELHPTLVRQLRRLGLSPDAPPAADAWVGLLARVNAAYGDADNDRYTLERSIEVSSDEMRGLYEELRQQEQLHRSILEHAAEGIVTVDGEGVIQAFNAAAERIFGWDSEEIVGRSVELLVPEERRASCRAQLAGHVAGQLHEPLKLSTDLEGLRRDGRRVRIQLSMSEVRVGERRRFTGIVRDVSAVKELEEALQHQALHDTLTGLPNRALFLERLEATLAQGGLAARCLGVLFIDLDRFKVVNDSLGHEAGDRLLTAAAERIRRAVRSGDVVARLGGDEFVVLCPELGAPSEVLGVAQRIDELLAEPFELGANEAFVSASIGIALAGPDSTAQDLLRSADLAMYRAKTAGRHQFALFDREMQEWADSRLETENALRRAIQHNELELHGQPVHSLADGSVQSVEALLRWNRPGVGLVAPAEFIPIAEETGLIVPLGAWVLEEACRCARRWRDAHPERVVPIAVNLSARELAQPHAVGQLAAALERHGLAPAALAIELTETTLLADSKATAQALAELTALGASLSIDDFGAGYSSLAYLRRIPASVLKVDRSFVTDVDHDPAAAAIVGAVVTMSHALGLSVVAEGVERADQADALRRLGCDAAQGWLYARPTPLRDLDPFTLDPFTQSPRPAASPSARG
ncbi:MAG: putative bifunctional diguanylate cyclase/phosphodiesterase [Acidimicrobiales bacterium]